jgi:single-strand DNA-binding protein
MASYNRAIIIGNLTRDPELRYTPSGTAVCEVGVAVSDKHKSASGEWIEETSFFDVVFWARTAEIVNEYLHKGSPCFVEGRLKQETWDTQDGQKRSKVKIICEKLQLLGTKGDGDGGSRRGSAQSQPEQHDEQPPTQSGDDGEIPF